MITKAEAEAVVGGPLIGPELSPQRTLCKYYEAGYGDSPSRIKLVTVGWWVDDQPDPNAVNTRRTAAVSDRSLLPLSVKELAGPADASIWVWAGNRLGSLYAFKGGTTEVAIKISGTSQEAALAAAKRFAVRALGGVGRTTFAYAEPTIPLVTGAASDPRLAVPELTRRIEQQIAGISGLSFTYTLGYRDKGADPNAIKPLVRARTSYKKPGLAREETVSLYTADQARTVRVYRLEGSQYHVQEKSGAGPIRDTAHPAGEWDESGVTPGFIYSKIRKRVADHVAASLDYRAAVDVYVLTFNAPDRATFQIYGQSWSDYGLAWLPYSLTELDTAKNVLVTTHWNDIQVNPDLPAAMFRLPN